MMDASLRALTLVLALPCVVEGLTEAEAMGWARWATAGSGPKSLAATAHAQVGAGTVSPRWPPYMERDWWAGAVGLEEGEELATGTDGSIQADASAHPCFWGLADECDVIDAIEQPPELSQQPFFGDTLELRQPLPCMTTEECTLEQGAGIAHDAPAPTLLHNPADTESVTQHSCWWDEGCALRPESLPCTLKSPASDGHVRVSQTPVQRHVQVHESRLVCMRRHRL